MRYCRDIANAEYGKSDFVDVSPGYKLQPNEFWADKEKLIVERVIEPGIGNDMQTRNTLNINYFVKLGNYLKENPVMFKPEFKGLGVI